jgi:hypothetical protein
MPKVRQGRLDGVDGMNKFSSVELFAMADEYESKINDPNNSDDPKWLKRRADRLRALAIEKEKAKEHKARR